MFMNGMGITTSNSAILDARWRELQNESARTKDDAVLHRNAQEMADIVTELEKRRIARDMELRR